MYIYIHEKYIRRILYSHSIPLYNSCVCLGPYHSPGIGATGFVGPAERELPHTLLKQNLSTRAKSYVPRSHIVLVRYSMAL